MHAIKVTFVTLAAIIGGLFLINFAGGFIGGFIASGGGIFILLVIVVAFLVSRVMKKRREPLADKNSET